MRLIVLSVVLLIAGCTSSSTKIALEGSSRVKEVNVGVAENYSRMTKVLMYKALVNEVEGSKSPEETRTILNEYWNLRDQIEFLNIQSERATAMHIMTIDSKLYSDQSWVDLWIKRLEGKNKVEK